MELHQFYIISPISQWLWSKSDNPSRILIYVNLFHVQPDSVVEGSDIWQYYKDRPSVKAVVHDFDSNCNWIKLNQALFHLRRDDVTFITGACDESIILRENAKFFGTLKHQVLLWKSKYVTPLIINLIQFLGPGLTSKMLAKESGKVPVFCAKPSKVLENYVLKECNIKDPSRVLFIGDS